MNTHTAFPEYHSNPTIMMCSKRTPYFLSHSRSCLPPRPTSLPFLNKPEIPSNTSFSINAAPFHSSKPRHPIISRIFDPVNAFIPSTKPYKIPNHTFQNHRKQLGFASALYHASSHRVSKSNFILHSLPVSLEYKVECVNAKYHQIYNITDSNSILPRSTFSPPSPLSPLSSPFPSLRPISSSALSLGSNRFGDFDDYGPGDDGANGSNGGSGGNKGLGGRGGGGQGKDGGRDDEGDEREPDASEASNEKNCENINEETKNSGVVILDVGGMSCGGCASSVKNMLESEPNVLSASVNLSTETAIVEIDENKVLELNKYGSYLAQNLSDSGFTSTLRGSKSSKANHKDFSQSYTNSDAIIKKREDRLRKIKESGKRVLIAWTLAAVCITGHAAHFFHRSLPSWLHILHSTPFHAALSLISLIGPGRKLIIDGWNCFWQRRPNMNTLVGLGAVSSFTVSSAAVLFPRLAWPAFFEEPIMLLAFVLLGRALEERAKLRASSDMTALLSLIPTEARLLVEDRFKNDVSTNPTNSQSLNSDQSKALIVPTSSLSVGDTVLVLPGDRIPVDGVVTRGRTTVDESTLTGEPLPVLKKPGDEVTAGTINYDGSIEVKGIRSGESTTISEIVRLVENAQLREAPIQRLADQVSGKFCYGVMALSGATFAFWSTLAPHLFPSIVNNFNGGPLLLAIQLACNVLVIACPCALGLATPTAVLVGTSLGARRGLLIRGGDILERMRHVDTIVFDKTGTITIGRPTVTRIVPSPLHNPPPTLSPHTSLSDDMEANKKFYHSESDVIAYASAVEKFSSHPVARAITEASRKMNSTRLEFPIKEGSFQEEAGSGASAMVNGHHVVVGNSDWILRNMPQTKNLNQTLAQTQTQNQNQDKNRNLTASNSLMSGDLDRSQIMHSGMLDSLTSASLELDQEGSSVVHISIDGRFAGSILMSDEIRKESTDTIKKLKGLGYDVYMLSGDKSSSARKIAKIVGIDENKVHANMRPEGKAKFIEKMQKDGKKIAMVGDGINDSIALSLSDIGISMVGGIQAAQQSSSIVLMRNDLSQVMEAVELSRATFKKIKQNLAWAFMYNIVGLPLASGALLPLANLMLTPSTSGALMGLSSLGVMFNSLMLQFEFRNRPVAISSIKEKNDYGLSSNHTKNYVSNEVEFDIEKGKST